MNPSYISTARTQLEELKQIMMKHADTAIHPMALLIMPDGAQVIMVMEWRSPKEKEIVLRKMCDAARAADAVAVILLGTSRAYLGTDLFLLDDQADDPVMFLFAGIHVPDEKVYCLGQIYSSVGGELVFLEEMNSSSHYISPFKFPPIWDR